MPRQEGSVPLPRSQRLKVKLLVFLVSFAFSSAAFISFDYSYSAAILPTFNSSLKSGSCVVSDPVLYRALKPNCAFIERWGRNQANYFTNSLGLRDEKIREVPLHDDRPRILMLGNSFTESEGAWRDSYVGITAAHFPQYDFINGGVDSYSPSNYLTVARRILAKGVEIDEVIVFIGIADLQDEAAFYRDIDASGAVTGPARMQSKTSWCARLRFGIARHLMLTSDIVNFFERFLVGHGYYHLPTDQFGDEFDMERSAWTYRKVNETDSYPAGYAPLGVEGGIAKEKAKLTLLWQELEKRNIPISVVVYPYPAQLVHDTADSRQVRLWHDWCEGKCRRFISLFPAFLAVKNECPWAQPGCWYLRLFTFGDNHYNPAGNALVADAVIQNLVKTPPGKLRQDSAPTQQSSRRPR